MLKKLGSLFVLLLGLALLVYSATRSLHFISMTLPPDRVVLAYFALAALDGGLLFWLLCYLHGSAGSWQRGISLLMTIIDFLGCVAMFTADTLYTTGQAGLTAVMASETIRSIEIGLSLVIAANIAATVAFELLDPDALKRQADQEASDEIEDLSRSLVSSQAKQLAATIAPQMAETWKQEQTARYADLLKGRRKKITITEDPPPPPLLVPAGTEGDEKKTPFLRARGRTR